MFIISIVVVGLILTGLNVFHKNWTDEDEAKELCLV